MKRVRITLEVDSSFVRLLQANLQIAGALSDEAPIPDVLHLLGIVALGEMRGARKAQIEARVPPTWRDRITVVSQERRWREEEDVEWHKTGD